MKDLRNLVVLFVVMSFYLLSCHDTKKITATPTPPTKEIPTKEAPCIDESKIHPHAPCTKEYAPVCGCNGQTYPNKCYAAKSGVTKWTAGDCGPKIKETGQSGSSCIDPSEVQSGPGACPRLYKPVCGCDGKTYSNKCLAKRGGVKMFTEGKCGEGCIDASKIGSVQNIPKNIDPVCGCNGESYTNLYAAKNAGLLSWKKGKCK